MTIRLLFFALVLINGNIDAAEFSIETIEFQSRQVRLTGSIVAPTKRSPIAAVVFVHGSGPQKRNLYWAKRFADNGIITLVYDKRGVGESGGVYESQQSVSEKNINLLADDALAAFEALRKHPTTQGLALGYTGISQAGWIVPIAAEKSGQLDFIALWSAPVCKVSEEDIFSRYTADRDGVDAGGRVPSFQEALNARTEKYRWPKFLGKDSNPSDHLQHLDVPGLWIFGGRDGSIPVDLSIQRLDRLSEAGHEYEYILYSHLGHNNMPKTFESVVSWIKRIVH
ncbi:alpha/beta hydrolase family protein [Aliikangiella marina]|nr:prolyl oligopeptidase family serine peptidase [Aliikangiella marina]